MSAEPIVIDGPTQVVTAIPASSLPDNAVCAYQGSLYIVGPVDGSTGYRLSWDLSSGAPANIDPNSTVEPLNARLIAASVFA